MSQAHRKLNYEFGKGKHPVLHAPSSTVPLTLVDLQAAAAPVIDQGAEGKCTACAVTGVIETKQRLKNSGKEDGPFSTQGLYYLSRAMRGHQMKDTGSTVTDAMTVAIKQGLIPVALWPDSEPMTMAPSAAAMAAAAQHRLDQVDQRSVPKTLQDLWATLAADGPIAFGFQVPTSFMSKQTERTGVWMGPQKGDKIEGGHAVGLFGYHPGKRAFKVRNSWGVSWGQHGYVWMPEAFVLSNYCDDFHGVVDVPVLLGLDGEPLTGAA